MTNKMKFETPNLTAENVAKIAELFPGVVTEGKFNFDLLRTMLGDEVYGDEAYEFTWVGKRAAIAEAGRPIRKTLRPVHEDEITPTGFDSNGCPYCSTGSKNWDTTENLYIEGDNLDVLKLLQESYLGKVKMIYIDPPYNTGNDFIYRDDFKQSREEYAEESGEYDDDGERLFKNTETNGRFHSDWCSMIYPRLVLARNMLAPDGAIFISIDDGEVAQLRQICNEIFGESNMIAEITIASNSSKNNSKYVSITHEFMLCYAKSKTDLGDSWSVTRNNLDEFKKRVHSLTKSGLSNEEIRKELLALVKYPRFFEYDHYTYVDNNGAFRASDLTAPSSNNFHDVIHPVTNKPCKTGIRGWAYSQEAIQELIDRDRILWGKDETIMPQLKNHLHENETTLPKSILFFDSQSSTKWLKAEGLPFDFAKSVDLIKYVLETCTNESDIILDFFSGSATTAHAVMQLNAEDGGKRKFIMVQLPEVTYEKSEAFKAGYKNICEIGKERICRAGDKIKAEAGLTALNLDIGFRVLKLDDTNMNDVYYAASDYTQDLILQMESNIKPDRTDIDLLYGCLLDWGLPLSMPHSHEKIDGFTVHTYNDGDLIACFEERISEKAIREIASQKPLRAVFRDSSFSSSPEKINVFEIFKLLAPSTNVRVI